MRRGSKSEPYLGLATILFIATFIIAIIAYGIKMKKNQVPDSLIVAGLACFLIASISTVVYILKPEK